MRNRPSVAAIAAILALTFTGWAAMAGAANMNPVPPPATGAYLGALVNPYHGKPKNSAPYIAELESQMAAASGQQRTFALHLHFYGWNPNSFSDIRKVGQDPSIADDFAKGRTPILTLTCPDSLRNIASGADDDAEIRQAARAIAALRKPVMLRWFHEFNFNLTHGKTNGQALNCFDTDDEASQAQEYVAAWRHMHDVFVREGATNVSWIWCPGAPPQQVQRHNLMAFFPGPEYVDWIGADFYDKRGEGFARTAMPFYTMAHSAQPDMPLIIVETGERKSGPVSQAQYLQEIAATLPTQFPQIKAVLYFDNPGNAPNDWTLTPDGIAALGRLAANPYFAPRP